MIRLLHSELRIVRAFVRAIALRPIPERPANAHDSAATIRRTSQYGTILFVLVMLIVIEVPVAHMLLAKWLGTGGWKTVFERVLLVFAVYGGVWLIGDARAMRESAHTLEPEGLSLALGERWKGMVPYGAIAYVARASGELVPRKSAAEVTPIPLDAPNVVLHLRRPVVLRRIFHVPYVADEIRLFVDEPEALVASLRHAIAVDATLRNELRA
ncbi:hypothetical protein [Pendulispora albinea]|uniref:Uncharacterized protein n=1 Tax=Pendulispora albinea TaxID=2741071 RepID=A0ABZ2LZQ4_9BACT